MPLAQLRSIILAIALAAPLAACVQPTQCGPEMRSELEVVGEEVRGTAKFVSVEKVESNLVSDWGGLEGIGAYPLDPYHRPGALVMLWAGEAGWQYAVSLSGLKSETTGTYSLSAYATVACGCPGVLDLSADDGWRCSRNGVWGPARCLPVIGDLTVRKYETTCADLGPNGESRCAEEADLDVRGNGSAAGDAFTGDFTLRRYERIIGIPLNCE